MNTVWEKDDRVCLPTFSGRRDGVVVNVAYDNEVKVRFDDDPQNPMWYPPNALISPDEYSDKVVTF